VQEYAPGAKAVKHYNSLAPGSLAAPQSTKTLLVLCCSARQVFQLLNKGESMMTSKRVRKPLVTRLAPILAAAIREKREATGQVVKFRKFR
jgi:hypothetical protein